MNIAIGGILFFLLVLPGMLFRSFVIKSESFENPLDTSFKAEVSMILLYSILGHYIGLCVVAKSDYFYFHFAEFYLFFLGKSDMLNLSVLNESVFPFFHYLLGQILLACMVGLAIRKVVISNNLDLRGLKFPISNEWDNILSGRLHLMDRKKEIRSKISEARTALKTTTDGSDRADKEERVKYWEDQLRREPDYTMVHALVKINGEPVTYSGRLHKFYLASNNSLSKIVLKQTVKVGNHSGGHLPISEQKMFVVPYRTILNMDVEFMYLEKKRQ